MCVKIYKYKCVYNISSGVWQWKNFVNQPTFSEIMIKSQVYWFFWDTVYEDLIQTPTYRYFATDKISLKVETIDSDNYSVSMTIIILPHAHILLA